jgi:tetrahydromethanopterin S-methyltransferase subunit B
LKLQKLFEDNFDEEVVLFPRVKKLQKLNLNFNVGTSEIDIQTVELRDIADKIDELEEIKLELMPSVSVQDTPLKRFSQPARATSSQYAKKFLTPSRDFALGLPKATEQSNEESFN